MLKKRLIGAVVVKNNIAVQSFGYRKYLPLGKVEHLVENLDRWGADEILVSVIDRSSCDAGPDFDLVRSLAKLNLSTPLIYAGGIRGVDDAVEIIKSGADRVCVDSLLHEDVNVVSKISHAIGQQAVIGSLPVFYDGCSVRWTDYKSGTDIELNEEVMQSLSELVSEFLIIDWKNQGGRNRFDENIVRYLPEVACSCIVTGGLSEPQQIKQYIDMDRVSAIAVGNSLNYRENSVQTLKEITMNEQLRPAYYDECFRLNYE
ncbi:HisA/HisF-related TIM barrel protein [Neptuniibacter sp. QD37_6]|uniref:HisA/HisF-related TIM barrel protein n=1 Tax=Neptuniibacter sp. QD37_6 TaxID=3398210 RepID=UPI0039F472E1